MNYRLFICLLTLALFSFACEDTLELESDTRISEAEQEVLEDCQSQALSTRKQIEENLIGSWELVGYACGNCIDGEAPTASIRFQVDGGHYQYEDEFEQIDASFTWRIEERTNLFGDTVLSLTTDPIFSGLFADVFCQSYMTYNWTPVDGPLLIYAKQ